MTRTAVTDWQELSALYEHADALEGAALDAWLAGLQAESHPLLASLKQMLDARAQVQANGFLGTLPHLPAAPEPVLHAWRAGQRIGAYRLLRHLGAGGMAEVWLAQRDDGAFQRTVAIKLLFRHAASHQRDNFAQRFARERDILASLHHPNIAGLHDAGVTPSGQPWLALEYVEGESLTAWCDAARLSVEARVRLFRQVLLAVQHAHANLVIHRDLKPANILVTAQGEVRLLDFGIAKLMEPEGGALAETELTRQAGRPLTVQYASPEQLTGQPLTTACDVYSLGVVLYELLCGERPYALKLESAAQLEQAILDVEPREPSRRVLTAAAAQARGTTVEGLRKRLASDLDAIVLRALAKRPEQRYGSAEALRVDLDRWLAGEAVEARTPSRRYRLRKFVGRHALSVSLGASAMVALASAASVAVWFGVQARQESARAVASKDFMLDMFKRADPEKARGASVTAGELLDTARRDISQRLPTQPELQVDLLQSIAAIQADMGEYTKADSAFADVLYLYLRLGRSRAAAMAAVNRAENALWAGDLGGARASLKQARSIGGSARDHELQARLNLIDGWIAGKGGELKLAQEFFSRSLKEATLAFGPNHTTTLDAMRGLAKTLGDLGEYPAALTMHDDLAARAALLAGLDARELASIQFEAMNLHYKAGAFREALNLADAAIVPCQRNVGPNDEGCRRLQQVRILALLRLGWADRALAALQPLEDLASNALSPERQAIAAQIVVRVQSAALHGMVAQGLQSQLQTLGQSGEATPQRNETKARALLVLAESRLFANDGAQAEVWALQALSRAQSGPVDRDTLPRSSSLLGMALLQKGQPQQALLWFEKAQEGYTRAIGIDHPVTLLCSLNRARALQIMGRAPEGLALVVHAEPVLAQALGRDAPAFLSLQRFRTGLEANQPRVSGERSGDDLFIS